jgi:hypothetical protein
MSTNDEEVSRLCEEVSGYLRGARHDEAARWYEQQARALRNDVGTERAALIRAIHESVSAGAGGPLGVVLTDGGGKADDEATTRYKGALDRLFRLTTQSRWRDWLRTWTG